MVVVVQRVVALPEGTGTTMEVLSGQGSELASELASEPEGAEEGSAVSETDAEAEADAETEAEAEAEPEKEGSSLWEAEAEGSGSEALTEPVALGLTLGGSGTEGLVGGAVLEAASEVLTSLVWPLEGGTGSSELIYIIASMRWAPNQSGCETKQNFLPGSTDIGDADYSGCMEAYQLVLTRGIVVVAGSSTPGTGAS